MRKNNLEPLLVRAVKEHDWVPGRVAAIRLIAHLSKVSESTVAGLLQALRDDQTVQQAAVETLSQLHRVDQGLIPQLVRSLSDRSAIVAQISARLLSAIGRAGDTTPSGREQIVAALANAVRAPQSRRGLYEMDGSGISEEDYLRISYTGRLDHVCFQALLEVTGTV